MNKTLIAVYGSLRKGLHNHRLLENSTLLGTFNTEPEYSLYSLGSYPGLKNYGNTSVVMEVYEVDDRTAMMVDGLEGYNPNRKATFYDKIKIDTPFGEANVYVYVDDIPKERLIESGDWKQYMENKNIEYA